MSPHIDPLRLALLVWLGTALACAHPAYGPDGEQRLAEAVNTQSDGEARGQLQACDDQSEPLAKARNVDRTESERLRNFMEVVRVLTDRNDQNQKLFSHNPEVAFAGGSDTQASAGARQQADTCREMLADARREFEELVRDLFSPLLVLDVQGAHRGRSARVSLALLRSGVQELNPPDQEALLEKIADAERILQATRKSP